MSDEKKDHSRIIKPGQQLTKGGKYNISRDEAVSIAVQIGQEVYDHVAEEHKKAMEILQRDMHQHFREIRETTAGAILDLQRRSIWFNVAYDLRQFRVWLEEWYWAARYTLGLVPDDGVVGGIEPEEPTQLEGDPENVGAPTEQPLRGENDVVQESAGTDSEAVGRPDEECGRDLSIVVEERVAGSEAEEPEAAQGEREAVRREEG